MTNELISNYGSDNDITAFVDKYDFYMFPIVNVDGMSQAIMTSYNMATSSTLTYCMGRFQIHSDRQPHVAQESPTNIRKQLPRSRH